MPETAATDPSGERAAASIRLNANGATRSRFFESPTPRPVPRLEQRGPAVRGQAQGDARVDRPADRPGRGIEHDEVRVQSGPWGRGGRVRAGHDRDPLAVGREAEAPEPPARDGQGLGSLAGPRSPHLDPGGRARGDENAVVVQGTRSGPAHGSALATCTANRGRG